MRGLFLRHTQHNAHTMQRENKRHRSHISDGWWTQFSSCRCRKLVQGLMCTWENEYLCILLTRCVPLTESQRINKYIHTRNLTTSWPRPMVYNVAQEDGHSRVGSFSERRIGLPREAAMALLSPPAWERKTSRGSSDAPAGDRTVLLTGSQRTAPVIPMNGSMTWHPHENHDGSS